MVPCFVNLLMFFYMFQDRGLGLLPYLKSPLVSCLDTCYKISSGSGYMLACCHIILLIIGLVDL